MRAVFPGRPQPALQTVDTCVWSDERIIAYITGNALAILNGPNTLIQTIYADQEAEFTAITINRLTGQIATCTTDCVFIFTPLGEDVVALRWSLSDTLRPRCADKHLRSLSWSHTTELLVSGDHLTLFTFNDTFREVWTKQTACQIQSALFSPDSSFIASIGRHDRLVKIWRSRTSGGYSERFDVAYLPHPSTVTRIQWREQAHEDHKSCHVLFTICSDGVFRIWSSTDAHSLQMLDLCSSINLNDCIQPRFQTSQDEVARRFLIILDSTTFKQITKGAAEQPHPQERGRHHSAHLYEIAKSHPDVVVVLDNHGHLSAWGLEDVGNKVPTKSHIFNLAHAESFELPSLPCSDSLWNYLQIIAFPASQLDGTIHVLLHSSAGNIQWSQGRIDRIFDPVSHSSQFTTEASWTGHAEPIERLIRTANGKALLSRTVRNEATVWQHEHSANKVSLLQKSIIASPDIVLKSCMLRDGELTVLLHQDSISLWDTRSSQARRLSAISHSLRSAPLCLMSIPESKPALPVRFLVTVTQCRQGLLWMVHFDESAPSKLVQCSGFKLPEGSALTYFRPVDPAGAHQSTSRFFDIFAHDFAVSITQSGNLSTWTAKIDAVNRSITWLETARVETMMENASLVSGTSIRKAAVIDTAKTLLTIWDTRSALLEYSEEHEPHETIQDLDWTSTPDQQSVLAVGFSHRVLIYAQLRYDYMDTGPSWTTIREINIKALTSNPIVDSIWLSDGDFVVAAGQQMFLYDRDIENPMVLTTGYAEDTSPKKNDLFGLVSRLNGQLPVFHPQLLSQCILAGKMALVVMILKQLLEFLKFHNLGDEYDYFLGINPLHFCLHADNNLGRHNSELLKSVMEAKEYRNIIEGAEDFSEEGLESLDEMISSMPLPSLSRNEQLHLSALVQCIATVEKHRRSVDENASRYLAFFRQHCLRIRQETKQEAQVPWREITWAQHSNSQEILIDLVSKHYDNKLSWRDARESGIFMWVYDNAALKRQLEMIARNEYNKGDDRDPVNCSLYYLALRKKTVLSGLWRMARWHREQAATQRLLANDFSDPRWKTVASKNAYALLGKRRFEYAAAFFLLADRLQDAVGVLASQLGDLQLAVAVARVYEGEHGPVLRLLLEDRVLPQAALAGDRWLAHWALWRLNRRDMALRALIEPLHRLLDVPGSPPLHARLYLTDDPALVVLYRDLRDKSLQTLRGALQLPPTAEWNLVVQSARLYDRMGCDLLALDLVYNWEFLQTSQSDRLNTGTALVEQPDPRKLLRRRSSLVVDDLPNPIPFDAVVSPVMKSKYQPTLVEEPSATSILDSFDF